MSTNVEAKPEPAKAKDAEVKDANPQGEKDDDVEGDREPPLKKPRKHSQAERLEAMKKVRAARAQPIGKHMQVQIVDALEGVSESVQEFMNEFTPILKSLQGQTPVERKQDAEAPVVMGVEAKGGGAQGDGGLPSNAGLIAGGVLLGAALIYGATRMGNAQQDPFYPGRASRAPLPPPTLPPVADNQQAVNQTQLLPDWAKPPPYGGGNY